MEDGDRKRRKEEGREQEKKSLENVLLVFTTPVVIHCDSHLGLVSYFGNTCQNIPITTTATPPKHIDAHMTRHKHDSNSDDPSAPSRHPVRTALPSKAKFSSDR